MHIPRWAWLLLPLMFIGIGFVVMLMVVESASTRFTVTFPVSAEVARGRTRRIQTAWALGAGVPVLCVIVGVAGRSIAAILGSAIVVGALSILIAPCIAGSGQSWQRGRLTADGRLILRKGAPEWTPARDALLFQA